MGEGEDWEKRIEKLIALLFFFSWSWQHGGWRRITGFQRWPFTKGLYFYIHATRGAGSNLIPCSSLTKCTNIYPIVDISHAVRSSDRLEVGLFLAADSSHVCVGHLLLFLMVRRFVGCCHPRKFSFGWISDTESDTVIFRHKCVCTGPPPVS